MNSARILFALILTTPHSGALTVGGSLQLADGTPVAGPASLTIEQVGGEAPLWHVTTAADGTWSLSDPLLFGNLRFTGSLPGHSFAAAPGNDFFVDNSTNSIRVTCILLTAATTQPAVAAANGITLRGIVGPQSQLRTVAFEWGFTTGYGNTVPVAAATASSANAFRSAFLPSTQLPPGRTIHYRLKVGPGITAPVPPDAFGGDRTTVQPLTFVEAPGFSSLIPVKRSHAEFADFNADGRMDLIYMGTKVNGLAHVQVVENVNGQPDAGQLLQPLDDGELSVTDANADGAVDVLATGAAILPERALKLYLNDAGDPGNLTDRSGQLTMTASNSNLLGTTGSGLAWLDVTNSGLPGFLLTGIRPALTGEAWRNFGGGFYGTVPSPVPACNFSTVAPAHINNDGRIDALVMGSVGNDRLVRLLFNTAGSTGTPFSEGDSASIPPADNGDAAWADSDGDGDMDFVIAGASLTGPKGALMLNDGSGHFTDAGAPLTPLMFASCAWGDVDADGDPDLFMMGQTGFPSNTVTSILYLNQGGNVFTPIPTALPALQQGDAAWGRWDTDSRLDLLLTGERPDGTPYIGVWTNPFTAENAAPSPPSAASLGVTGQIGPQNSSLTFHWGLGTDATTPSASLTYNIRIGSIPGLGNLFSGNVSNELVPLTSGHGQMQTQVQMPTGMLVPGKTYHWSVQAVDAGYAVSPWVQGTPVRFGFQSQSAVPESPTAVTVSATMAAGLPGGEFAVEFFPLGQPQNLTLTEFIAWGPTTSQTTLTATLTSLEPGRTYFYRFLLRSGGNQVNLPLEVLATPVAPEIISLQRDAGGTAILTFRASPVPEPVAEISSNLQEWNSLTGSTDLGGNLRQFALPARFADTRRLYLRVRVGAGKPSGEQ